MHTIKNNSLQISVKNVGAELCSIKSLKSGKEYMWDANSKFWGSHAPVLFPIIGSLKNGEFLFETKKYSVPKHGLIRNNNNLKIDATKSNRLEYSFKFNDESLKLYPFQFEFFVRYILTDNTISVEHEVINHSHDMAMYFSLGGHPAFKCPINSDEQYSDYYLEFEKEEFLDTWELQSDGLIGPKKHPLLMNNRQLSLDEKIFNNGALIIKNLNSKIISLKSRKTNQVLMVDYREFSNLALWAIPGAQFICIEPWLGLPDNYNTNQDFIIKEGNIKLNHNKRFKASYTITIME